MDIETKERFYVYSLDAEGKYRDPQIIEGAEAAIRMACVIADHHHSVVVTDSGDMTVFLIAEKTVIFPPEASILGPIKEIVAFNGLKYGSGRECPFCHKRFAFSKPYGEGEPWEREQHISGCCSQACWDKVFSRLEQEE